MPQHPHHPETQAQCSCFSKMGELTPSAASTKMTAPSLILNAAVTSSEKFTWPTGEYMQDIEITCLSTIIMYTVTTCDKHNIDLKYMYIDVNTSREDKINLVSWPTTVNRKNNKK